MQIYAIDAEGVLQHALRAKKQFDYRCLECGNSVRLRSGMHRQAHYYHLQPNTHCSQHAKGMVHLLLQHHLKSMIPEAQMECRFPAISRIADIAWHAHKVVFEIQCSPIAAAELLARTNNYLSIGYRTVWIFHDQRYNQEKLSAAEDVAQRFPHYFSNMDAEGNGTIYDQFALIDNGVRRVRLPCMTIDPSEIQCLPSMRDALLSACEKYPHSLWKRVSAWPVSFAGDLIHNLQKSDLDSSIEAVLQDFMAQETQSAPLLDDLLKRVAKAYRIVFRYFLERACQ